MFVDPLQEPRAIFPSGVLGSWDDHAGHDEPRGIDADVHAVHREEAAQHQACASQQHERERDLDDDQSARPAPRANAAGPGSSAFLEHLVHVGR